MSTRLLPLLTLSSTTKVTHRQTGFLVKLLILQCSNCCALQRPCEEGGDDGGARTQEQRVDEEMEDQGTDVQPGDSGSEGIGTGIDTRRVRRSHGATTSVINTA